MLIRPYPPPPTHPPTHPQPDPHPVPRSNRPNAPPTRGTRHGLIAPIRIVKRILIRRGPYRPYRSGDRSAEPRTCIFAFPCAAAIGIAGKVFCSALNERTTERANEANERTSERAKERKSERANDYPSIAREQDPISSVL
jgi:hypothetical protein